jgi:hypothetical protein
MGLDVFAISKITRQDDGYEVWVGSDPEYNKVEIEEGGYISTTESKFSDFRAGPYSFYNRFRETLSMSIHGVMPTAIWDSVEDYEGKPFIEMINHSDCEGCFGAKVSAKLHEDFAANRHKFKEYIDTQGWHEDKIEDYLSLYDDFMKAFGIGREEGIVKFC